ncbi:MAG: FAD-dependent oxidoreductase [Candidatus Omnitrophica bacterium]|nr:FAD-dependent oxidoreductase [Candidatus Omnitrophota bacterium]
MEKKYDYIIVGAGLCGLVLAKELVKKNKTVLLLEKGGIINNLGSVFPAALFYDKFALAKSIQGVTIFRVFGVGGTSIVSCGNAVDFTDKEYNQLSIDFKDEIAEAKKECFVRDSGLEIGKTSHRIMDAANKLGYEMFPMPKFSITGKCLDCGHCSEGCKFGIKWSAKKCWEEIKHLGIDLITRFSVKRIIEESGKATGVEGKNGKKYFADKIILSAGGIGTPIILQNSGIEAGDNLFVDLFHMTYGVAKDSTQAKELSMSVVCTKFHKTEGFVLSPFVDPNCIGLFSGLEPKDYLNIFKRRKLIGIMTKINDDSIGKVYPDGTISKAPTENDLRKLKKGRDIAKTILVECGVDPKNIFVTKLKGAHPGGTAAIGKVVDNNLETKLKNLFVCDASVLPFAPGLPPMLPLIAMTKWFAKKI